MVEKAEKKTHKKQKLCDSLVIVRTVLYLQQARA